MHKTIKLVIAAAIGIALIIFVCEYVDFETVKGNELGVKETWSGGVEERVYQPKTYMLTPGWSQKIIHYDASSQVFVMNERSHDAYRVQSQEGQDLIISLNVRWRIDPAKLVSIHKTIGHDIPVKVIRPQVMRIIKDEATRLRAIDAYSGEGLVKLQSSVQNDLTNPNGELRSRGVIVENFVIEHIELDPNYVTEIKARQVATQKQLRAVEETKAAEADALKARAMAQADLNKMVVEAERDKQVGILKALMLQTNMILAAEAEMKKKVLEGEAEKQQKILSAEGVLALGKAEAEAQKLKLSAYAVPGAVAFTQVEIARALADGMKGIQGYLPQGMTVNLLGENFMQAVKALSGAPVGGKDGR